MKNIFVFLLLLPLGLFSQKMVSKEVMDVKKFQEDLNAEYLNPKETPLRGDNFSGFKGHPFFPFDMKYRVTADFKKTKNPKPFEIPTSSGKTKTYREYGKATFKLNGENYTLTLYQSLDLIKQKKYRNYLFLPFRDATNGKETYGGGKYMDLTIPKGNTIILDFNQSYQPYCAYNAYDYNCPIVPEENKLPVEIRAGVMYDDVYHH
ncbi:MULTISPECIES: DUF1684 domain-containing protein [Chryseobacterium]|uniref:Uncharacterized protein (DUF1684 family) n=1 Tax=Chryseobacterium camelliae TaxID=1265445 RepID=A0ABU0TD56_9FLAO|nr:MULTISPECIES: DUF1684 domain-containing protein [Chryseobacterium]MDT3407189.1 uncharacterized protein (DUF1684 family) [Pseudacidovorax intermedius]MDQ1095020.1 uncharacterized protein (DUF1684 family) [Chryseobacterium camelliae]MDQ1098960.1 uncharacterized protein (DUF1684 family) [Chryseobacterium sp. SORGH_AS_1048]MDR6086308.1 uncharacterized protein (DUF1684 family) [Chryseobacterium sp. SORGH_AS_0909]MDR6130680.1 uncharacterized protein (DUF1684 family) [Chryseobacterium sp. SORGH_AS